METTFGIVMFMIVVSIMILAAIEMQSRRKAKSAPQEIDRAPDIQVSQCRNAESAQDSIQQQGF